MGKARAKRKTKQVARTSLWPFAVMGIGAILIIVVGFLAWRGSNTTQQASAGPEYTGGARLSVDRDSIDFGKVALEQWVKADFTLKNTGDETLRILGEPRVELIEGC